MEWIDKSTSAVLLEYYGLNNNTALFLLREDGLRNREQAAACALPTQEDYSVLKVKHDIVL